MLLSCSLVVRSLMDTHGVSSRTGSARSLPPLHHSREETRDWAAHLHDVLQRAPPAHYNPLTPRHKCAVCGVKG